MENSLSFFYLSDVKKLFFEKKYHLIIIFFVFLFLTAFFLLIKEPKFEAKSSFLEDTEKSQTIGNLKDIVLSDTYSHSSDAFSFLKTKTLNKKLVVKLGLQILVIDEKSRFKSLNQDILKNLKRHFNKTIEEEEVIEFFDVFYDKPISSYYYLNFLDKRSFEIFDSNKKFINKQNVNEPIKLKDFCFTIYNIPQKFLKQTIKIKVDPWCDVVNELLKNIEITKERNSPNFLFLKTKHSSGVYAAKILNTLMEMYHEHLVSENENFIKNQIRYLEKRKNDHEIELFSFIDESEKQTTLNVKTKGFVDLKTEVNNLLNKRENYQRLLDQTNQELDYLKKINLIDLDKNICVDENILNIIDEIKRFQDKKQALQISIDNDLNSKKNLYLAKKKTIEIDKLLNEKNHIDSLIEKINRKDMTIYSDMFDFKNSNLPIAFLKQKTNFLNDEIELLKLNDSESNMKKLSLLDLNSAKDLHLQLDKSKDELNLEIDQIKYILNKINSKDFQISSISIFLPADLIKNIIEISKKIKDEKNYTSKEIDTLRQEYDLEKKYIINHLEQFLNLKKLNLKVLNQKLFSLKKIQINLIANEISFLSSKAKDLILKNIYEKTNEKKILQQNLSDIKSNLQNLINKITQESKLNLKSEMTKNMIESITKLIESKKLDLNLKKINSQAVDSATVSIYSIHLFRNSFIVAFLFVFIFFIIFIYTAVLKGFFISSEMLRSLSFDYCGSISNKCDGIEVKKIKSNDLESLRKIIVSIDDSKHKIITSICSKGPNYIHYLGALLAIVGKKVLIIETKSEIERKNGLFSFLENGEKKIPIQKMQAYDFLPSGEKKYFAFELLKSLRFLEKLQQLKSKYDLILIYSDAKIDSAQARIFLDFSDKVILSFKKETLEDIKLFINWAKEKTKLCFVTY